MPYIAPCSNPVESLPTSSLPSSRRSNITNTRNNIASATMTNANNNNNNMRSTISGLGFTANAFSRPLPSNLTGHQPQGGYFQFSPESPASSDDTGLHFSSSASSSTSSIENDYDELKKAVEAMAIAPSTPSSSSGPSNTLPSNNFSSTALLKKKPSSSTLSTLVLTTPTAARSTTTLLGNATKHTPTASTASSSLSTPSTSIPSSPSSILRKKSGERVKSSLKLPSLVRHQSMPATSKMVHFDAKLERVRHFLYSEKPTAVSAQSSPTEERPKFHWGSDSDHESEPSEDEEDPRIGFQRYLDRTEWQISLPNYNPSLPVDNSKSVFVESIFLSVDKNKLIGNVAVKNLTFEKHVSIRYSLDNWKTITEISAEYNPDVRRKLKVLGYDRFTFSLNLCDFPQHYTKSVLFFCVRFADGNGDVFWDNNNGQNYQVIFTRVNKVKPVQTNRLSVRSHGNGRAINPHRRSKSSHELVGGRDHDQEDDEIFGQLLRKPKSKPSGADQFAARYDFGSSFSNPSPERTGQSGLLINNGPTQAPLGSPKSGEEFALNAKSYQELIDSYCFFHGPKSTPAAKTHKKPPVEDKPASPALYSCTPMTTAAPTTHNSSASTMVSAPNNGASVASAAAEPKP